EEEAARRTDELVEAALLPAYPAMRLIHDLRDPASRAATIDHAVVIGDRAILIDSIMVEPGSFTWDGSSLTASGAAPALTLPRVIEQARLWLDPWRVSGVTVLHSTGGLLTEPSIERVKAAPAPANPRPGGRSTVRGGDPEPTTVLNPTELMDFLREAAVLEARTHVVNVRLLRAVLQLRPDARPRS
ncbi:MAG TPA: hypothetical protein GX743_08170, partial [Actinomycetales bacterium]|nr:hypothetical protein [Actinomycetales bacterium]